MSMGVRGGVVLCAALVLTPLTRAADQPAIDRAVEKAVACLKRQQQADGTWKNEHIGATALCGLALLEAGVKPDDAAVQKAARAVREQGLDLTHTYSLALDIMFLDLLGEPADAELIESLAVRLLAGQDTKSGGWSYNCPPVGDAEVQRLRARLRQRTELVAQAKPPEGVRGRKPFSNLTPEIQQQVGQVLQQQAGNGPPVNFAGAGDNSNTQFAIFALWIARRQGIPADAALQRLEQRFRFSQNGDGGWCYQFQGGVPVPAGPNQDPTGSTPTMTCAGLLGLALSHGSVLETTLRSGGLPGTNPAARRPTVDPGKDPAVRNGLAALGLSLKGVPLGGPAGGRAPGGFAPPGNGSTGGRQYYFLFSLERVGVAFGLDRIGGIDWYDHGANILLHDQNPDGSWTGEYAEGGSDTCFGILFLRRANLALDLTAVLKGRVSDVTLRVGGIGGEALLHKPVGTAGGSKPDADTPKAGNPPASRPAPGSAVEPAVVRLADELVNAPADSQEDVLTRLRDSKGPNYTDALAYAIHKVSGPLKAKARDALADRLTRMSPRTLAAKLQDDDLEVRRAAALAVAMKEDRTQVPRLIELLEDPEPPVAHAAYAALKALSGQDFGPGPEASRADVGRAAIAWKAWWSKNGGR
jgi:hypothetical protein